VQPIRALILAGCLVLAAVSARAAEVPTAQAAPPTAAASPEAAAVPTSSPGPAERIKAYQVQIQKLVEQQGKLEQQLDATKLAIAANRGAIEEAARNLPPAAVQP
jgi:hypothetical protein